MNAKASPRPWRVIDKPNGQLVLYTSIIKNSDGLNVAFVCRSADAALIVDAVNHIEETKRLSIKLYDPIRRAEAERDRLRDLVRQALPFIEGAIDSVSTILGDAEMSKAAGECGAPPKDVMEAFVADGTRVLREARAAIGEDEQC